MNRLMVFLKQIRVHHWIKNVFVFPPLLFSGSIFRPEAVLLSIGLFVLFCLISSGVYVFNDIIDLSRDRSHPSKKLRPLAQGLLSTFTAICISIVLIVVGLVLAAIINRIILFFLVLYLINNLLYCLLLKNKVIADVLSIAIGFMLRFIGGAVVIGVEPSRWLLICGFSLSLFLAFGKRRAEVEMLKNQDVRKDVVRATLEVYDKEKLNASLSVVNGICIITYLLFVTDPSTISLHKSDKLIYTVPIVVYCLFRYMYKAQEGEGSGPVDIVFRDKAFLLAIGLWLGIVMFILY